MGCLTLVSGDVDGRPVPAAFNFTVASPVPPPGLTFDAVSMPHVRGYWIYGVGPVRP